MYRIALQAGHQNIQSNCTQALQGGTGAPGEMQFTVAIRDLLAQILQKHGFQLFLTDANANCNPSFYGQDYDLFLAIHYDADVYHSGGGLAGAPDPSVDYSHDKSQAIADIINSVYFPFVNVALHKERINPNITFYYMWQYLSASTPCVLVECGTNTQDQAVLNNHQLVATGLARSICQYFGVPFTDSPTATPVSSPPQTIDEIFKDFVNKHNNQHLEVEDPTNLYQCFDLITGWVDALKIPRETIRHLDAYEIYTKPSDLTKQYFDIIANSPTGLPPKGAVVVWSSAYNGGAGHTGIATGTGVATGNSSDWFECFEQNDPLNSPCHVKKYSFDSVLGWLVPKNIPSNMQTPPQNNTSLLQKIHDIIWGSLPSWTKVKQVQQIVPK